MTSTDVEDEIWSALEYYSEIERTGKAMLAARGVAQRDLESVFRSFRAYIRQAKAYYEPARSLHFRSASLLYYYAFLNLAKAGLVTRNPSLAEAKLRHGLSYDTGRKFRLFRDVMVNFQRGGTQVFDLLYAQYFGRRNPLRAANVSRLLGYVSDVAVEYQQIGLGQSHGLRCLFTTAIDADARTSWALIGIHGGWFLETYPKTFGRFLTEFERVELGHDLARRIWNTDASEYTTYHWYQQRQTHSFIGSDIVYPTEALARETVNALNGCLQTDYFSMDQRAFVFLPYAKKQQALFDETLAIYVVTFYLGSLIRYRPEYVEAILETEVSWLLRSFVRASPATFLRGMMSWILDVDHIYLRR